MTVESVVITNIYLFVLAMVFAVLEIQIEGEHGWAKNLPTWRPKNPNFFTKLYSRIMSGKELTGYHLSIFSLVFLVLGLPYVFGYPLTLENFLKTISLFLIFSALWDFLWFVLNPYYPLKQFKKEYLAFHHKQWFLGVPVDYFFALIFSFLILLPVALGNQAVVGWWLVNIGSFGIQTILLIFISLFVLKIDNWHSQN